jgi:ketosteroid isomerase-like protein
MSDVKDWSDALVAAVNAHDIDTLVDCFAEDYINETPAHPLRGFQGRDQVRRNWTSIFTGVPDIQVRHLRRAFDGPIVWSEMEMAGTRRDGAPHLMRGVVIFEVDQGRAQRARFYLEPVEEGSGDVNAVVARSTGVSAS